MIIMINYFQVSNLIKVDNTLLRSGWGNKGSLFIESCDCKELLST